MKVVATGRAKRQARTDTEATAETTPAAAPDFLIGALEMMRPDGLVCGWAWDGNDSSKPAQVAIHIDNSHVATLHPQQFRPDLLSAGIGHGCFGFMWNVPDEYRDGQAHEVRVHHVGLGLELPDSPRIGVFDRAERPEEAAVKSVFVNANFAIWPNGLHGAFAEKQVEIGAGIWLAFGHGEGVMRFSLAQPRYRNEEQIPYYGIRLSAEGNRRCSILHQLSLSERSALDVGATVATEIFLTESPDAVTQRPAEIWLIRQTREGFQKVRRLGRGRVFRRPTLLTYRLQLSPDEAQLLSANSLFVGISVDDTAGFYLYPGQTVRKTPPPATGFVGFEDVRLERALEACRELASTNSQDGDAFERLLRPVIAEGELFPQAAPARSIRDDKGTSAKPNLTYPFSQILIPVFNGSVTVLDCLRSIQRGTDTPFQALIINDGSTTHTGDMLRNFAAEDPRFVVFDRENNRGYTKSVNESIKLTGADWVVLLNSDTVVSSGWLARLHDAAITHPECGMVGPLSNAASWQSIPKVKEANGTWATNSFIRPQDVDRVQQILERVTERGYPEVPLLNGFCTMISRRVFEQAGLMDEESFPIGYGEENDLCIRAKKAGFSLHVADDCFVYHQKSATFGGEARRGLSKAGNLQLLNKHMGTSIASLERALQENVILSRLRRRLTNLRTELG